MAQGGDMEDAGLEGGCVCGKTRYRLRKKPLVVHCCHCSWCQRETGSAFAVNALIEAVEVELQSGLVSESRVASASGAGQRVCRCTQCQTTLWSYYAIPHIGEQLRFLRVGTLDVPADLPPDVHIYVESKLPWVQLTSSTPYFAEYYRLEEVWTPDSLRRRQRLKQVCKESQTNTAQ